MKVDWPAEAKALDSKSPLDAMDHALKTFGGDIAIAFSGAEDVALIEYAKLTGRPFRVFRCEAAMQAAVACRMCCPSLVTTFSRLRRLGF